MGKRVGGDDERDEFGPGAQPLHVERGQRSEDAKADQVDEDHGKENGDGEPRLRTGRHAGRDLFGEVIILL